jgi:CRP/FNR family transcriptional regulator/CRP/FNR family cyclic AMP-dependent transcriptional regulator
MTPRRKSPADPARPATTVRDAASALAEIPLFAHLSGRQRTKVARLGVGQQFPPGAHIMSAGTPGIAAYILLGGRCEVSTGRGTRRREIGPGAIVGELALLDGAPRSATVVARTEVRALCLGRRGFVKLLRDEPGVALAIIAALGERLRDAELKAATPG